MARAVADIEHDIRQLTQRERDLLLRSLIAQIDGSAEENVEQAWLIESQRRLDEIVQGKSKPIPGPQVIAEARDAIRTMKR